MNLFDFRRQEMMHVHVHFFNIFPVVIVGDQIPLFFGRVQPEVGHFTESGIGGAVFEVQVFHGLVLPPQEIGERLFIRFSEPGVVGVKIFVAQVVQHRAQVFQVLRLASQIVAPKLPDQWVVERFVAVQRTQLLHVFFLFGPQLAQYSGFIVRPGFHPDPADVRTQFFVPQGVFNISLGEKLQ